MSEFNAWLVARLAASNSRNAALQLKNGALRLQVTELKAWTWWLRWTRDQIKAPLPRVAETHLYADPHPTPSVVSHRAGGGVHTPNWPKSA